MVSTNREIPEDGHTVHLPFGTGEIPLSLPMGGVAKVLHSPAVPPLPDFSSAFEAALIEPIGTKPLHDLARTRNSACIVVSDTTRPVPNDLLLPKLLAVLKEAGIPPAKTTILIANGMHEGVEPSKFEALLGPGIAADYPVVNHDCHDANTLREVAKIDGVPIAINTAYLDAELKILTGMVEPHGLAGFSGGGKSILPGIASFESMTLVHSYRLLEEVGNSTGVVDKNPLRKHIGTVTTASRADFLVNVLLNRQREISGIFCGDVEKAFEAAYLAAKGTQLLRVGKRAGCVITTGGGAPLDRTFYQGCKGLVTGASLLGDGGTLLFIGRCENGLGSPGFVKAVRTSGSPERFREIYSKPENFTVDQWALQTLYTSLAHAGRVIIHSPGITEEDARAMGMEKAASLEDALEELFMKHPEVYLLPEGPYVSAARISEDSPEREP